MLFGLLFIGAVLHLISFVLIYNIDAKPVERKLNLLEIMKSGDNWLFLGATEILLLNNKIKNHIRM